MGKNILNTNENSNYSKIIEGLNNVRNNSRIKLKPIVPIIRSITPLNCNLINDNSKNESKNIINGFNYNNKINSYIGNTENNNNNIVKNISENIIEKKTLFGERKNHRQFNFNKLKVKNLSQIKTKFANYVIPNYKNIEMANNKTDF